MSYNLNDDDYKEYVEMLCLANLPIEFYGEYLRHLTIKEIMLMGDRYNLLIAPFTLSRDMFDGYEGKFYTLDVLLYLREYLDNAIAMLELLFDTKNIEVFENEIIVNGRLFIDRDKFEELTNIILKMSNVCKYKKNKNSNGEDECMTLEQIEKIKDPREKRYQMRIYENTRKEQKKKYKSVSLYNVYNCVSNLDGIDYEKTLRLNVYQLYNSFTILNKKEQYDYSMKVATSGYCSDVKKLDLRSLPERVAFDK